MDDRERQKARGIHERISIAVPRPWPARAGGALRLQVRRGGGGSGSGGPALGARRGRGDAGYSGRCGKASRGSPHAVRSDKQSQPAASRDEGPAAVLPCVSARRGFPAAQRRAARA